MSKPQIKPYPEAEQQLVTVPGTHVSIVTNVPSPAFLEKMKRDAGKGLSTASDDNLIPIITLLQKGSPQVDETTPAYIQGAKAGDVLLKGAPSPLVPGDTGFEFQPCHFYKELVEWKPRKSGGGRIGGYAEEKDLPEDAIKVKDPDNPNKIFWRRKNGNEIIPTRYHIGYVIRPGFRDMPFVISLASTGHTFSRSWMTIMNGFLIDGTSDPAPMFSRKYLLTTFRRENSSGVWYQYKADDRGWVNDEQYDRGNALHEAFVSGEKQVDSEDEVVMERDPMDNPSPGAMHRG